MKKIMIVDDDNISNFVIDKMISKIAEDVHVDVYTNPEKAFNNISSTSPGIIFLDLNMPIMNGISFLNGMKEQQFKHEVYVLSSSVNPLDKEEALEYENVKDYLLKPLAVNTIKEILNTLSLYSK